MNILELKEIDIDVKVLNFNSLCISFRCSETLIHSSTRLTNWKVNSLSLVGHITLAKSVIEAIMTYSMMTNLLHKSCLEEIQKMKRKFIWGDTGSHRKMHVISWNIVTLPKDHEGLWLKDLATMNKCLHHKA